MMIQEFTKLTGFTPTENYYTNVIEREYMASNLDKEAWCKQWKRNGGIQRAYDFEVERGNEAENDLKTSEELRNDYYELYTNKNVEADNLLKHRRELENQVEQLRNESEEYAHFLIVQADAPDRKQLRAQAIAMLGEREYITVKIENNFPLSADDRDLLLKTLKNQ